MIEIHSPTARRGVEVATPLALLLGTYLLFAGHNNPGGGFAAGLVFGCVVALRSMTGLLKASGSFVLIAVGILIVTAVAFSPLLWGDVLLDMQIVETKLPILGKVKSGSAFVFDIGVTAIVVGLVVALLNGLGSTPRPRETDNS